MNYLPLLCIHHLKPLLVLDGPKSNDVATTDWAASESQGNQYWTNLFNLCSVSRRLSSSARRRSPSYRSVREAGEPAHVQQQKTCDKSRVHKHSAAVCSNRAVIGGLMEDRAKLELSRQVQTERLEGCEGIPRGGGGPTASFTCCRLVFVLRALVWRASASTVTATQRSWGR